MALDEGTDGSGWAVAPGIEVGDCHGPREEIALAEIAASIAEVVALLCRLDAFPDDSEIESLAKLDDGARDGTGFRVVHNLLKVQVPSPPATKE